MITDVFVNRLHHTVCPSAGAQPSRGGSSSDGSRRGSGDDISLPALSKELVQAKLSEAEVQRKLRCGTQDLFPETCTALMHFSPHVRYSRTDLSNININAADNIRPVESTGVLDCDSISYMIPNTLWLTIYHPQYYYSQNTIHCFTEYCSLISALV
jgi:hypothetical protein